MIGVFLVILIAILMIGIGYAIASSTVGRETAQRNLRRTTLLIPLGFVLAIGLNSLGKYAFIICNFLFAAYVSLWILTWNWRKRKAGVLLLDAGRISARKLTFWCGVFEGLLAILKTWSAISQISTGLPSSTNMVEVISQLILYWSLAILLLSTGLSRLELRENGICYMFSTVKWGKLTSYKWSEENTNVVTIGFKSPRFPLARKSFSLSIPSAYRDAVDRILAEHLMMA